MRKISTFRYTVENNPNEVLALLREYNVPSTQFANTKLATNALKRLAKANQNNMLFVEKVLSIHPDAKLFRKSIPEQAKAFKAEEFSSADAIDQNYSYIDDAIKSKLGDQNKHIATTNVLIGVGVGLGLTIALVGLMKMIK